MRHLARLVALILPHWRWALLGIALSVAALLFNVALLALSSWFIASMAIAGSLGAVMEYGLPSTAVRALALSRAASRYAERLVNHGTTLRILSTLRVWFFRRVEPLAPARLEFLRGGDLLSRIGSDVDLLDDFYVRGLVPTSSAILGAACFAAFLARFDRRLAWIDLAALAASGLLIPMLLRRPALGRERVELASDLRASVVEQAQGMAELVALGAVIASEARIVATSGEMELRKRRLESLEGMGEAALSASSSLAVWLAAVLLGAAVGSGALAPAQLPMLTAFVLASFEAILPLPAVIQRAGEMTAAAGRLFRLIDAPPAVIDPPDPAPERRGGGPLGSPVGLRVQGLRFRYGPDQPLVLDGLALEVAPGGRIGIAGVTGAGKSTLVSLLLRFWEYEAGVISVFDDDGRERELRAMPGDAARAFFAVSPQSPYLFHTSLRENLEIAGGELDTGSPGGVGLQAALEAAQLAKLVSRLPDGLDTLVGEAGAKLSAGEVKRVAVARALLKPAPILILDEPTEGLDERAADAMIEAVDALSRGRTLLVISHRARDLALASHVVELRLSGPGDSPRSP